MSRTDDLRENMRDTAKAALRAVRAAQSCANLLDDMDANDNLEVAATYLKRVAGIDTPTPTPSDTPGR